MTAAWPFPPAGRCFYCDCEVVHIQPTRGRPMPKNAASRDHLTPVVRGGGAGIVLACEGCNIDKGQLTLEEYRLVVAFRKGSLKKASLRFPGEEIGSLSHESRNLRSS
jgi:hypothetical protein